jgi:transcriptional regulator with XRE-family HTH domain
MSRRQLPGTRDFSQRVQQAFGKRLRAARFGPNEVSQLQVAQALGVTRSSVSNIEHGRQRVFLDQVFAAAKLLQVSVESLLPTEDEITTESQIHITDTTVGKQEFAQLVEAADKAVRKVVKR